MSKYLITALALIIGVRTSFALVTGLTAEFRGGKTFITFKEDGDTAGKTYNIYRSVNAITSVSALPVLVNIPSNSSWDPRYSRRFVIVDRGQPLDSVTGLFVYTPKETADVYYAVTTVASGVENTQISAASNSLASVVHEAYWPWPKGVFVGNLASYNQENLFFYWMDYFDWAKNLGYYGDYFKVNVTRSLIDQPNVPLLVNLHGYGGTVGYSLPTAYCDANAAFLLLNNPCYAGTYNGNCMDYWYGRSNHFLEHGPQSGDTVVGYTEMRILQCLQYVKYDTALFHFDTNRIYVSGGSMGGAGSYQLAFHYPDLFAASKPMIARINFNGNTYTQDKWSTEWGMLSAPLPARNGLSIYQWMDVGWLAKQNPGKDYPPILDWCSSNDGLHPFYTHRYAWKTFAETRHVIFGQWAKVAHSIGNPNNVVFGDMYRFVRNEMTPAFSNSTVDSNWGKTDSSVFDTAGIMNGNIDWSSSRHRLGLPGDSLIDSPDSLCLTMKASKSNTAVDITPRRLQRFPVLASQKYTWNSVDVASGVAVDSGEVTADVNATITILQLAIATTGTRLAVKPSSPMSIAGLQQRMLASKLSANPNPFNSVVRLKFDGGKVTRIAVYDMGGRLIENLTGKTRNNAVCWNVAGKAPGVYVVKVVADGHALQKRIVLMK